MATTTNFGWTTPDDTDLVKDGAAAIRTLGSSIDTSLVDLKGGTTGQILAKASGTDLDFNWVADAGFTNPMTTTADLIYSSSGSTPARLGIGTAGQVLQVNSGATAPEWATPAASAPVSASQYVGTSQTTTSTSFTDLSTVQSVTLTTGTKALVILKSAGYRSSPAASSLYMVSYAVSGATTISASNPQAGIFPLLPASSEQVANTSVHFVDSLNAGSNTFTMKFAVYPSATTNFLQRQITVIDMGS